MQVLDFIDLNIPLENLTKLSTAQADEMIRRLKQGLDQKGSEATTTVTGEGASAGASASIGQSIGTEISETSKH